MLDDRNDLPIAGVNPDFDFAQTVVRHEHLLGGKHPPGSAFELDPANDVADATAPETAGSGRPSSHRVSRPSSKARSRATPAVMYGSGPPIMRTGAATRS